MNNTDATLNGLHISPFLSLVRQNNSTEYALIDQSHRILCLTDGFASFFAPKKTGELIGLPFEELIHSNSLDSETTDNNSSNKIHLQNGRSFNYEIFPMEGSQPFSHCKIVALYENPLILNEIERHLNHRERLVNLGSITASIIHQLAAPLSMITNSAELLLDTLELENEVRQRIKAIYDGSVRLTNQFRKLLSFVHNDELDVKAQNVVKLMEDVLEIFQFCNLRDIKYQLHVEKNLPLISGNGELLQQIFFNLLKNAVDASEEGGEIKIKIYPSIRHLTNNVCAVEFAIEDNGSGISPESIESVFDLFVTTKPHGDGTGLGLPMARRIVEAHGGTLHLESELGKGTKAIVRLPVWSKSSK